MTAEDLLRMPEDGFCYELIRGELRKMSPPGYKHGRITSNVHVSLGQYVKTNNLGVVCPSETGFKIASNPDTDRAPDVAFISRERVQQVGDIDGYWPGAPDLVVEVISPNDVYSMVEENVFDWLMAGTKMVIAANPPKHTVTLFRSRTDIIMLTENDRLEATDIIPGWSMKIQEIFES